MIEPRSTATIRALAGLAELSADQLEDGASIEDVIATLRKAAEAVRIVIDETSPEDDSFEEDGPDVSGIAQDLTPMELTVDNTVDDSEENDSGTDKESSVTVLNAG
jgi:hypothetical protein